MTTSDPPTGEGTSTSMLIADAQRDLRRVYVGGFYGQLVSGAVWLLAAAATTWVSTAAGTAALWFGGMLIFPLTALALRVSGRAASLGRGHPFAGLATQIAFTVPIGLLVALALATQRPDLFFPAAMVVVGAHYLPFVFLYGMRLYAVLAAVLVLGGVALAVLLPGPGVLGAWGTGAVLVVAAFALRHAARES
ncbi:hypothetical protein [Actinotalea sp. K2]|uniref:DUF7010 family protein n=1 Tax=Actinotalea sp. K2 TaxID=2939438 RepID=UPI0020174726|nr:hypothetical protein [Actinotalea sp. K2]MCL3859785.1 hypothetical protein [Actinotalea sp. K2]